ncbi:MAG: ATP-binding cassette domain-containing protein [Coprobacillaceae bacterium]
MENINVIEIKDLTKRYGDLVALDSFCLNVKQGEVLGLLGPNGSGKSTCINTVLSLLKFDKGSIKMFGKEMTPTAYDIKSKIGVVFQDVAVFEELSVIENIDYFCGLYIKDKKLRKQYVEDALKLVSLEEFTKFKPKQLSGGLLRRLNIACGVAHKPSLIFLDEPTVAVDPQSRNNILEGIKVLNENGATIVYTTHYMEEVEQLCNNIVVMDKGQVIMTGTKDELKNSIALGEKITVEINQEDFSFVEELKTNKNISNIDQANNTIHIAYNTKDNNLGTLIDFLREKQVSYESIFSERPTLNDVFLELTGKELRD